MPKIDRIVIWVYSDGKAMPVIKEVNEALLPDMQVILDAYEMPQGRAYIEAIVKWIRVTVTGPVEDGH